jgi:hypothetical protein
MPATDLCHVAISEARDRDGVVIPSSRIRRLLPYVSQMQD